MVTITSIDDFINQDAESRSVIAQKHTESLKKIIKDNPQITDSIFAAIVNKAGVTGLTELRDIFGLRNELMSFVSNPSSLNIEEVLDNVSTSQPGFAGVVEAEPAVVEAEPVVEAQAVSVPTVQEQPTEEASLPSGFGSMGMPRSRTPVAKAQGRSPVLRTSRTESVEETAVQGAPVAAETVMNTFVDEVVAELAEEVPTPVVVESARADESGEDIAAVLRKLIARVQSLSSDLAKANHEITRLKHELAASEKRSISVPAELINELKSLGIDI